MCTYESYCTLVDLFETDLTPYLKADWFNCFRVCSSGLVATLVGNFALFECNRGRNNVIHALLLTRRVGWIYPAVSMFIKFLLQANIKAQFTARAAFLDAMDQLTSEISGKSSIKGWKSLTEHFH